MKNNEHIDDDDPVSSMSNSCPKVDKKSYPLEQPSGRTYRPIEIPCDKL